jgi:uncharacterized membrane protein YbhN (UPF0104 family)
MADNQTNNPLSQITFRRVLLPVVIGIAVSLYLIFVVSKVDTTQLYQQSLTRHLLAGLLLALLTVVVRDLAYIYRIWQLTDCKLSFLKCFEIIMLWEFGSAVTPASVGGITLALFILKKEKISFGKGTSIILLCSYLDNIAFVTVFSLLFLILGNSMFDLSAPCPDLADKKVFMAFRAVGEYVWIGFLVVAIIGGLLGFGIFVKPRWAQQFFAQLSKIKWLQRWHAQINLLGEEIWLTSQEFQTRGYGFLFNILIATIISWSARYFLANVLIWTFTNVDIDQIAVFGRQVVHRIIIMIPSTPGGSGVAELSFMAMNCDYLPAGLSSAVAVVWRMYNFYLYLAVGAIVLPRWIARVGKN